MARKAGKVVMREMQNKIPKLIFTLILILSFASSSEAYNMLHSKNISTLGNTINYSLLPADEDDSSLKSSPITPDQNETKYKRPEYATFLSLSPIIFNFLLGGVIGIIDEAGIGCEAIGIPLLTLAIASTVIGTIPAHIYVDHSWQKITGVLLFKNSGLILYAFCASAVFADSLSYSYEGESTVDTGIAIIGVIGVATYFGTYIYEIVDIRRSAKKYNEKIEQQQGLYVQPLAWKDQYQLQVGYRF